MDFAMQGMFNSFESFGDVEMYDSWPMDMALYSSYFAFSTFPIDEVPFPIDDVPFPMDREPIPMPTRPDYTQLCRNILETGNCRFRDQCWFNHNVGLHSYECKPCKYVGATQLAYNAHCRSGKHRRNSGQGDHAEQPSSQLFYPPCEQLTDQANWVKPHTEIIEATIEEPFSRDLAPHLLLDTRGMATPQIDTDETTTCEICNGTYPVRFLDKHLQSKQHMIKDRSAKYQDALDKASKDRNGVIIDGQFDFGVLSQEDGRDGKGHVLSIKATLSSERIQLVDVQLGSARRKHKNGQKRALPIFTVELPDDLRLPVGNSLNVKLKLRTAFLGQYEDQVEFLFEDLRYNKQFILLRVAKVTITSNPLDHILMQPSSPYVPPPPKSTPIASTRSGKPEVIKGPRPPEIEVISFPNRLGQAIMPDKLIDVFSRGARKAIEIMKRGLPAEIDQEYYSEMWKIILWAEEYQAERDLEHYSMVDVVLGSHQDFYHLEVPGLAEKRPSILVGDKILLQQSDSPEGQWFEGRVFQVEKVIVKLRFDRTFRDLPESTRFSVRFSLNRIPLRRQHQALDLPFEQTQILYPRPSHLRDPLRRFGDRTPLYNRLIEGNSRQLDAVEAICNMAPGSPPFILFGPPGTGKTMTSVESILQILDAYPSSKVVACAPSNSAADLLVLRLSRLREDEMFRFYAPTRSDMKEHINHRILRYTHTNENGHFGLPPLSVLKRYRVFVSTTVSVSVMHSLGVPAGHFTHIFIDEAGQATEPEALIGIRMLVGEKTNVILSGDPLQLGPIVRSNVARAFGLEVSYLERLMKSDVYNLEKYHGKSVVKLIRNFRSHPAILRFPNAEFYRSELKAFGSAPVTDRYLNFPSLPQRRFPIIFHAVHGQDSREAKSPSFFNIIEALQVKDYVQQLRASRSNPTSDDDIGIITPYHAQCLKIRNVLRAVSDGIKVGSVEEFQGQERPVIIISTVRSSKEFLEYDLRHTLGFVASPRRFNVAVTRAQSLLIIIGDPRVLSLDPLWRRFLNYVYSNGGWTGPDINWDPTEIVDEEGGYDKKIREAAELDMASHTRKLELSLRNERDDDRMDVDDSGNIDRPWRDTD